MVCILPFVSARVTSSEGAKKETVAGFFVPSTPKIVL